MFDKDAPNFSVKDILSGKSNYASVSRNAITADVQNRLKDWAKSTYLRKNPDFEKKYGYIFQRIESGNKLDTIELAKLANYDGDDPVVNAMRNIVNDTVKKYSSTSNLWDKDAVESMREAAYAGLDSTLGSADWSHMQDLELAEARKRAAEKVEDDPIMAKYIWSNVVNAQNDKKIVGRNAYQLKMTNGINKYYNGNNKDQSEFPKYTVGVDNQVENFYNYLLRKYSNENGELNEKGRGLLFSLEKDIYKGKLDHDMPTFGMTAKEVEEYTNKKNKKPQTKNYTPSDGASAIINANDFGRAGQIRDDMLNKLLINTTVTKEDLAKEFNEFTNFMNKGSIVSQGAEFYGVRGANLDNLVNNILQLSGDDYVANNGAKYFLGSNDAGVFVDDTEYHKDFFDDFFDDENQSLKDPRTRVRIHRDANNETVVSLTNNSKNSYAFNITKSLERDFPQASSHLKKYGIAQNEYINAENIAFSDPEVLDIIYDNNLSDEEKEVMLSYNTKYCNYVIAKAKAEKYGIEAYTLLYDALTMEQEGTKITNTVPAKRGRPKDNNQIDVSQDGD